MALNLITTTAGRAKILEAVGLSDTITVVDVQLSEVNQTVSESTTAIASVLKTLTGVVGSVRAAGSGYSLHMVITDDSADAYDLRCFGLRLSDTTLLMVYSQAAIIATKASGSALLLSLDLTVDADAAATIDFGDTDFALPAASSTAAGIVELATNAETSAFADATRAVTPSNLGALNASNVTKGMLFLATSAEVQVGTDNAKAVTSAGLASLTANDTRRGLIELATVGEAQAASDTQRAVTPYTMAQYCPDASQASKGRVELATTAEAQAGADTVRAITPARLKEYVEGVTHNAVALSGGVSIGGEITRTGLVTRNKTIPLTDQGSWTLDSNGAVSSTASGQSYYVQFVIPPGASLQDLDVYLDPGSTAQMTVSVKRIDFAGNEFAVGISVNTSGSSPQTRSPCYQVNVDPDDDERFQVTVTHSVSGALDKIHGIKYSITQTLVE